MEEKQMDERKYPCTGRVYHEELGWLEVTVLAPAGYVEKVGEVVHPIEMPEGFPEPPAECGTWFAHPEEVLF
jgi:hypothetical protein